MRDPDRLALCVDYTDAKAITSRRFISPIRWTGADVLVALCLGRGEPRQFRLASIQAARLVVSADLLMPAPVTALHPITMG